MSGSHPSHNAPKAMAGHPSHIPVLLDDVVEVIAPKDGDRLIDGTFGAGGYARAFLEAADCTVYAIDRDESAIARARDLKNEFGDRLILVSGRFSQMDALLFSCDVKDAGADGVVLDLGVSSMQLEEAERGFSFLADGPLDMRMSGTGPTAAEVVNNFEESSLADIIYEYGEERHSRRIARAIVRARKKEPIERTGQLAGIISDVMPGAHASRIHPATRTFQALRIYVNDELHELMTGLAVSERMLRPGGRLCVVSFHSLEDRIVKNFLRERSGNAPSPSRHLPDAPPGYAPSFDLLFRGARKPGDAEIRLNPRARSACLRAAVRTKAPAWPEDAGSVQ